MGTRRGSAYGAVSFRRGGMEPLAALCLSGAGLAVIAIAKPFNGTLSLLFFLYIARTLLADMKAPWTVTLWNLLVFGAPLAAAVALICLYNYSRFRTLLTFPLEAQEQFSTPLWQGFFGMLLSPSKGLL